MALSFEKTTEQETEGAIANVAEAALSEAANIALNLSARTSRYATPVRGPVLALALAK